MIELFHTRSSIQTAVLQVPQWDYVRRQYASHFDHIENHYRRLPVKINASHPLVKLINSFTVPLSLSDERYAAQVENRASAQARVAEFTSEVSYGRIFKGVFFSSGSPEVILATNDRVRVEELRNDWRSAVPVKALMHWRADFRLDLPLGQGWGMTNQVSMVEVKVPLLLAQHRHFILAQASKSPGERMGTEQFIAGHVLPNMMRSVAEIALLNKIRLETLNTRFRADGYSRNNPHPFHLPSHESMVVQATERLAKNFDWTRHHFDAFLKMMPAFHGTDLYESLMLPDVAPTRQVDWALMLARLSVFAWLCDMAGDEVMAKNQHHLQQVVRAFRRNDTIAILERRLSPDAFLVVANDVKAILAAANRTWL